MSDINYIMINTWAKPLPIAFSITQVKNAFDSEDREIFLE